MFTGHTLLITGGTGSFGNAVLDRFLQTNISEIRIFSRDEKKQDDMRKKYKNSRLQFYLGDVRDPAALQTAMRGVEYIFHAAALKQVPSCEFFPLEAVKTNVLGTENVLNAAIACGARKVVCLSTDKAAYPINAMGISKAMMEKVIIAKSRNVPPDGPVITCTRYGNVMCSRGSVIPLFIDQLKAGQSLTLTDPKMTRFLMSLEEAVNLVLFAFEHGSSGDLFIQKAPACTMGDLTLAVQQLFGREVGVKRIGTRHGEKVFETLLTSEERSKAVDLGEYFRVPADNRTLNYEKYLETGNEQIDDAEPYTSHNTRQLDVAEIQEKLRSIPFVREELWQ